MTIVVASDLAVSVVIPTYNGETRLRRVLEGLRSQQVEGLQWEIIIIDNNSQDGTAALIKTLQATWSACALKYCLEPRQGIAYARQRGVELAQGKYVGFLDDDTPPAANWVAAAYRFGEAYPQAGAYGSQVQGEFEVEPPQNFQRIESFFAIKKRGTKPNRYEPDKLSLPAGAGLVVRRQAWLESVPAQLVRTQRGGNDFEVSLHLHRHHWQIWYNPEMQIYHYIPGSRLQKDALLSLIRKTGLSICQLRLIGVKNYQKPMIISRILAGNFRRMVLHVVKYRSAIWHDTVTACEMEFFISSFMSPFQLAKLTLENTFKQKRS